MTFNAIAVVSRQRRLLGNVSISDHAILTTYQQWRLWYNADNNDVL